MIKTHWEQVDVLDLRTKSKRRMKLYRTEGSDNTQRIYWVCVWQYLLALLHQFQRWTSVSGWAPQSQIGRQSVKPILGLGRVASSYFIFCGTGTVQRIPSDGALSILDNRWQGGDEGWGRGAYEACGPGPKRGAHALQGVHQVVHVKLVDGVCVRGGGGSGGRSGGVGDKLHERGLEHSSELGVVVLLVDGAGLCWGWVRHRQLLCVPPWLYPLWLSLFLSLSITCRCSKLLLLQQTSPPLVSLLPHCLALPAQMNFTAVTQPVVRGNAFLPNSGGEGGGGGVGVAKVLVWWSLGGSRWQGGGTKVDVRHSVTRRGILSSGWFELRNPLKSVFPSVVRISSI